MSPRLRPLRGAWATRTYRCRPLTIRGRPILTKTVKARTSQISQGSAQGCRHSHRKVVPVWMAALWLSAAPATVGPLPDWSRSGWRCCGRCGAASGVSLSAGTCWPTSRWRVVGQRRRRLHHQQLQDRKSLSLRPQVRLRAAGPGPLAAGPAPSAPSIGGGGPSGSPGISSPSSPLSSPSSGGTSSPSTPSVHPASTGTGSPATDAAKAAAGGQPTGTPPQPAPLTQQLANTPLAAQPSVPAPPPAPAPAPEAPAPPPSAPAPSGGPPLRTRCATASFCRRRPRRWRAARALDAARDRRPRLRRRRPCLLQVPPRPRRWAPAWRPPPRPA